MKIKKIKRLIESLNEREIKQLTRLMETSFPKDSKYGKKLEKKGIEDFEDVEEIAKKIEWGDLAETKELLMWSDEIVDGEKGYSVAHQLAEDSDKTNWSTDDKEILMLEDFDGWSVAHYLAWKSKKTKWLTDDKDILTLKDNKGTSVAHLLADNHPTWITSDSEILGLADWWKQTVENVLRKKGKI